MEEIKETASTEPPRKKRRWLFLFVAWSNWIAIVVLFLSCFSPFVSPGTFWPMAFFALVQPVFVFINLLFLILWSVLRRRMLLWNLIVLLLSLPATFREFKFGFHHHDKAPAGSFRVMSYNVKIFDLYNWTGNVHSRDQIFDLIRTQHPDILCLQEFYNSDAGKFRNLDSLKHMLGYDNYHVEYTTSLRGSDHWGIVTFSRFPIIDRGKIVFNNHNNNICIYSDMLIGLDTVRVYNMHLQSIAFGKADYRFMNKVSSLEDTEDELESSKNILRRMKRAYTKRANQAESVASHIAQCHYKLLVCGDMNDTPVSYTYRTVAAGLTDSFLESGIGFGKTFINPLPVPRIDYIFHDNAFHSYEFNVIHSEELSDHYPIVCEMSIVK